VRVRLSQDKRGHGLGVVHEVETCAGTDLKCPPARRPQEFGAHLAQSRVLVTGEEPVVDCRDYRMPGHSACVRFED
jgi:hypothetical protein